MDCRLLRTVSWAPAVHRLSAALIAAVTHVPSPHRLPTLPSARSLRRTHGTRRQLRSLFPSDGPPLPETYPMAETRLQARKRVSDPLCQAARPCLRLLAERLVSCAKSVKMAIAQSLIPRRHMSELPHPIVVDCTITLNATQACQPLVSTTEDLVRRAAVRRPMTERRCIRFAWARAQACEWQGWEAIVARGRAPTRSHARCGERICTDSAWAPPALQGQTGATRQRQTQQSTFLYAVSPSSPPATPDTPASTRASRPRRNPSPGAPSPRPMPEGRRIRLGTTAIVVCGFVRTQHGPHRPIKDTHA